MKKKTNQKQSAKSWINHIRGVILIAGLALLILGISQNGQTDIRNKAIRICYECIGIA